MIDLWQENLFQQSKMSTEALKHTQLVNNNKTCIVAIAVIEAIGLLRGETGRHPFMLNF